MIKAVIFDLNGVFIKSRKLSERFEEKFGVKQEEFLPALNAIMPKVRMPDAGDAFSYWKPYFDKWGLDLSKEAFFDFWFSGEKEAPEMISLARELKDRGVKLFILSNNVIERTKFYNNNFPFLKELFEKVYYSWQTGFTKSNAGAYQKLLEENNLKLGLVKAFLESYSKVYDLPKNYENSLLPTILFDNCIYFIRAYEKEKSPELHETLESSREIYRILNSKKIMDKVVTTIKLLKTKDL